MIFFKNCEEGSNKNMLTQHVSAVLKLALTTFRNGSDVFETNLQKLIDLFNRTRAVHVNLNPKFMKETTWEVPSKAPMTYIGIFNNEVINMGIFVLKHNMILPLHNHPNMFGLLKVIEGSVKVKSFTILNQKIIKDMRNEEKLYLTVERNEDVLVNAESGCCRLDPMHGNVHEIETIGGPAAFIDILSPPYEVYDSDIVSRKCSYFRIIKKTSSKIYELEEIQVPSWFWGDSYSYTGPAIKLDDEGTIEQINK